MKKIDKYIYAFDVSMSNTGIVIFTDFGNPIKIKSISTSSKEKHPQRLQKIADSILELRNKYSPLAMVYESGFYRFSASTQAIYKVFGVVQLLFSDVPQFQYPPSTIRKIVCGNGRANKDDVEKEVLKIFPYLSFEDQDQSDACAAGLCYLIKKRIIQ